MKTNGPTTLESLLSEVQLVYPHWPKKEIYRHMRLALTGKEDGPSLSEICNILGWEEVLIRVEDYEKQLREYVYVPD